MHSVVLPNMLAAMSGFSSSTEIVDSTIPQMAPAARLKMTLDMRFKPAISTTLGIMAISFVPTYGDMLPLVIVDTISFGNPMGKALIAAAAMAVPPPPPSAMAALISPFLTRRPSNWGAALAMAAMHSPRSPRLLNASRSIPPAPATVSFEISAST